MLKIAVTGGIACGKTTVGARLGGLGFAVCEADELARAVTVPGTAEFNRIVQRYGRSVLRPDGALDRGKLAAIVFEDEEALAGLNAIVHPAVRERLGQWLGECTRQNRRLSAAIVPLLYEVGWDGDWDAVVCVTSRPHVQRERLLSRGLTPHEAACRMKAQMALPLKERFADYVIVNNGTLQAVRRQTDLMVEAMLETENGNTEHD